MPERLHSLAPAKRHNLSMHLWIGVVLVAIAWPLNWLLDGPRTHLLFFPLWLGYALVVDAVVLRRTATSILTRSKLRFFSLLLASVPIWWLFELFNLRTRNWRYVGRELFTDVEYAVLASIAFSTVVPAVFETADLWRSFSWTDRFATRRGVRAFPRAAFVIGIVMLALVVRWPDIAYPLVWLSMLFIVDPIAWWLRRGSLLEHLTRGDWQTPLSYALGALTCGFFWELWNWYSYPYWVYRTPGVEWPRLFQMPLLGYLGYIPFGLELHSMVHFMTGREKERPRIVIAT